ncbi:LamG domain-containing protein [Dactylosporangium sp. NBC_01737]|uniref:LamG-like jellyroll fold domain-containing protein n=1 Tax=Dactylosporangium sp. NBC_01737 TaxID=2975959 RepID=UPI002E15CCC3|nr:LamG domain-containing protein [Dactylosporangium sp. NBC_01737]
MRSIRPAILAAAALGVALSALGGAGPASAAAAGSAAASRPAAEPVEVAAPVIVARYTFDAAANGADGATVTDDSGHGHTLTSSAGHGGRVRLADRPGMSTGGRAADFPARCAGRKCPHAVLQAPDAPELNPGTGPVRYGATVRLTKKDTGSGQNIVQKGYSASGSQYKLQIDGAAGHPSCVFADAAVHAIHVAMSDVSVSDGAWHRLECRRAGTTLTMLVDDAVRGTAALPAELSVVNTVPLSIGGKGNGKDNDQFHGTLDDVWIARG